MYLLGTATSYIILPPPKISAGCDPARGCYPCEAVIF